MSTRNLVILGAVVAAAAVLIVVLRRREAGPLMLGEAPGGTAQTPGSPGFIASIATEGCVAYTGGKGGTQCAAAGKIASKFATVAGGAAKKTGKAIVSGLKKLF